MSGYFVGIDGGQTSTAALVADERGFVLGRGAAGPCDEVGAGADSRRLATALEDAVAAALTNAKLPPQSEIVALVAGISGYEGTIHGVQPRLRAHWIRYLHDAPIALAGALRDPGIAVISGTGSVVYGEDPKGRTARSGGWGYLFGDRGSAFWVARCALSAAMRAHDWRITSRLGDEALGFFGYADLRGFTVDYYAERISRTQLAAFAPRVVALAQARDPQAGEIVEDGALALARLVAGVRGRLDFSGPPRVALCGGMFESPFMRAATERAILADGPAEIVTPEAEPVVGALRLAYKEAGLEPPRITEVQRPLGECRPHYNVEGR